MGSRGSGVVVGVGRVSWVGCDGGCWCGLGGRVWWWVLVGSLGSGVMVGVGVVSVVSVVGCGGGWWWVLVGSRGSGVVVGVGGVSWVGCGGGC